MTLPEILIPLGILVGVLALAYGLTVFFLWLMLAPVARKLKDLTKGSDQG